MGVSSIRGIFTNCGNTAYVHMPEIFFRMSPIGLAVDDRSATIGRPMEWIVERIR